MDRDIGDILDRWSIAKLKKERIGSSENEKELAAFNQALDEVRIKYPDHDWGQLSDMIYSINDFIWQLEAGLKSGKEALVNPYYILDKDNNEPLAKIGATTIIIRNFNHLRVNFKNIVNTLTSTGFQDKKDHHLSE